MPIKCASVKMDLRNRNNISLKEKIQKHYSAKKSQGFRLTPAILNRWAPLWYLIVICGVTYWGLFDALPSIYEFSPALLQMNTIFGCFVFLEVMVNWFCIHFVDSSYQPNVHGTKPTESHETDASSNCSVSLPENGQTNDTGFKMYVASSFSGVDGRVNRSEYPYWSWVPCLTCQRLRPPRCHHCSLCNKCVLKRDHHCFFARACVGIHNQRHFMVFLFWTFAGSVYSTIHMIPYFYFDIFPIMNYEDIIPPVALIKALLGYQFYFVAFLMFLMWGLLLFAVLSGTHFWTQIKLIFYSVTYFEYDHGIEIRDSRTLHERLHSVFGHYWILNFIFPLHMKYKPIEDPVLWPSIKVQ